MGGAWAEWNDECRKKKQILRRKKKTLVEPTVFKLTKHGTGKFGVGVITKGKRPEAASNRDNAFLVPTKTPGSSRRTAFFSMNERKLKQCEGILKKKVCQGCGQCSQYSSQKQGKGIEK